MGVPMTRDSVESWIKSHILSGKARQLKYFQSRVRVPAVPEYLRKENKREKNERKEMRKETNERKGKARQLKYFQSRVYQSGAVHVYLLYLST
jgi:hypothetical protein